MGTRSNIAALIDGKVKVIYCHFDGYIEGVGQDLFDHYNSQERAEELIALGDLSCLGERCDRPEGHSYQTPVDGCTIAYGRDRGEEGTEASQFESLDEWTGQWSETWAAYFYYWDGTQWLVNDRYSEEQTELFVPLRTMVEVKTDPDKLRMLADEISSIKFPELETEEGKQVLANARQKIESATDAIVSSLLTTT